MQQYSYIHIHMHMCACPWCRSCDSFRGYDMHVYVTSHGYGHACNNICTIHMHMCARPWRGSCESFRGYDMHVYVYICVHAITTTCKHAHSRYYLLSCKTTTHKTLHEMNACIQCIHEKNDVTTYRSVMYSFDSSSERTSPLMPLNLWRTAICQT